MAPNAGDRHFRVFRVPASVFQVPVGGDGRPLADVLRGERAPMDALHRRPEAACPNVWQRIGVSEHDGRQAGAGPRSRNRLRAWERARRFMGTAVRPSFLTDRRDDMGGGILQKCGVSERRGKGEGVMSWLPSAAKESRLRTAERGGWRVGWKTSLVAVPRYSCLCSMVLRPVERLVFSPKER